MPPTRLWHLTGPLPSHIRGRRVMGLVPHAFMETLALVVLDVLPDRFTEVPIPQRLGLSCTCLVLPHSTSTPKRLKIPWSQDRVGSIPTSGTKSWEFNAPLGPARAERVDSGRIARPRIIISTISSGHNARRAATHIALPPENPASQACRARVIAWAGWSAGRSVGSLRFWRVDATRAGHRAHGDSPPHQFV